ncbi:MAG: aldo/keto reductase [Opitutales bacterium]
MKKRLLGNTKLEVSPLAVGCWAFAGGANWGDQDENESISVVHAALDRGINFFDTAPGYGNGESERVLGVALKGRRDQAVIATKVKDVELDAISLRASCEKSLSLLQTDRIDLLQIHWANRDVPFVETIGALEALTKEGKIRHVGVCNFGIGDMEEWSDSAGEMISNQLPYSLLSRSIEYDIIPECEKRDVSVLPYSPLLQGLLTGKFPTPDSVPVGRARSRHFSEDREQARHGEAGCEEETFETIAAVVRIAAELGVSPSALSLAWLAKQSNVASVIAGARNVKQLTENARFMEVSIDSEIDSRLRAASDSVMKKLGNNPDLWNAVNRFR